MPIQLKKGILMGINWEADDNHMAQSAMPDGKISQTFIKRSKQYLEDYLKLNFININFNYANLCFFRSPHESDLMNEDYSLSLPLFKGYVEYIKPQSCKEIPDSLGKFKGISGTLWGI